MTNKWDNHFLELALIHAKMSKDPSTKVGAVLVKDKFVLGSGFNGLPIGLEDTEERLNNRDLKLRLIVHAEMNAVLSAARFGIETKNSSLYICATDSSGNIWGGPPCIRCLVEIIQSGISEVVSYPFKNVPSRWLSDLELSKRIIDEVGIRYREISN